MKKKTRDNRSRNGSTWLIDTINRDSRKAETVPKFSKRRSSLVALTGRRVAQKWDRAKFLKGLCGAGEETGAASFLSSRCRRVARQVVSADAGAFLSRSILGLLHNARSVLFGIGSNLSFPPRPREREKQSPGLRWRRRRRRGSPSSSSRSTCVRGNKA